LFGELRHKSCFKSQKCHRVFIYLVCARTETYKAPSKHESALVHIYYEIVLSLDDVKLSTNWCYM